MFRNRSVQVKLVKTPKSKTEPETPKTEPVDYVHIAQTSAKTVVVGAGALIVTTKVADTLCRMAMHIVATKIN